MANKIAKIVPTIWTIVIGRPAGLQSAKVRAADCVYVWGMPI